MQFTAPLFVNLSLNEIAPAVLPERAAAETLRNFNVILGESDTARRSTLTRNSLTTR